MRSRSIVRSCSMRMTVQENSFLCTSIAHLQATHRSSIIYFSGGTVIDETVASCSRGKRPPAAILVLGNLTVILDLIVKGFMTREKLLVVVSAPPGQNFGLDFTELELRSSKLGYSRWLLLNESTRFNELSSEFPTTFWCFAIFLRASSVSVPGDFNECYKRKVVNITDSIDELETFSANKLTIVCNQLCTSLYNTNEKFVEAVRTSLNLSHIGTIKLHLNRSKDGILENAFALLGTRRADLYGVPLALNYERLSKAALTFPAMFGEYRMFFWSQPEFTMGSKGLMNMFDLYVWLGIGIYLSLQTAFINVAFTRNISTSALFVFSTFLGGPNKTKRGFAWKLNVSFLYFSAFIFGAVFRNKLTSCLNQRVLLTVNDASQLKAAIRKGAIDMVCLARLDFYNTLISRNARDPMMRLLAKHSDRNGIYAADTHKQCVDFLHERRSYAAVLPIFVGSPYSRLRSSFERANFYIGSESLFSASITYAYAPCMPLEQRLQRLLLRLFESETYQSYSETWKGRSRPPTVPETSRRALTSNDLILPLYLLALSTGVSWSIYVLTKLQNVLRTLLRKLKVV